MSSSENPTRRPLDTRLSEALQRDEILQPTKLGVPAKEFIIAERRGEASRICSGVYLGASHPKTTWTELAGWTVRYPDAVACLLTSARFHGLIPEPNKGKDPECWVFLPWEQIRYAPAHLRVIGVPLHEIPPSQDDAQGLGIVETTVHGCQIRYTDADRTCVDLLRYHDRRAVELPLETAQTALRSRIAQPGFDRQKFISFAERIGSWNRILPLASSILSL